MGGLYTLKLIDNDVDRIYFDLEASFVIVRSNGKIFEQITINILVNLNESPPPISRKGHWKKKHNTTPSMILRTGSDLK